ncbi:MAG: hypothetical protein ACR2O4_13820 [Hyphomicrobiaceae bacterium]
MISRIGFAAAIVAVASLTHAGTADAMKRKGAKHDGSRVEKSERAGGKRKRAQRQTTATGGKTTKKRKGAKRSGTRAEKSKKTTVERNGTRRRTTTTRRNTRRERRGNENNPVTITSSTDRKGARNRTVLNNSDRFRRRTNRRNRRADDQLFGRKILPRLYRRWWSPKRRAVRVYDDQCVAVARRHGGEGRRIRGIRGEGFGRRACRKALRRCNRRLDVRQSFGRNPYAACVVARRY